MTLSEQDLAMIVELFLKEKTDSLQREVRHCICRDEKTKQMVAPFSALLLCFSTIDLLGSLYTGQFNENKDTQNAKIYMRNMMSYSDFQITLLQYIFRHKLVHAAEPKWLYTKNDESYSWSCYSNHRKKHLVLATIDKEMHANNFSISIWSLVEDIVDSVHKDGGFLNTVLKKENGLFENFSKTFEKIMS